MKTLNPFLKKIIKSDWGQKFLILLSPFMLLPEGDSEFQNRASFFLHQLRAQTVAPFLGTLYTAGALAVLSRVLKKKGLHFLNLIDFDSLEIGLGCSFIVCILSYSAILGQYLAPRLLNFITASERFPPYSFSFWSAYYGGLLMFWGTLCWIPVGLLSFHFSIITWFCILILLSIIFCLLFRRIRERRRLFIQNLPYPERNHLKITRTIISYSLSLIILIPVIYMVARN